jgi:hypothetical protein
MMLTDLAAVLRGAGLEVVELPGWKTRGHGPMAAVDGVTCHHTGSGRGTGATLGLSTVRDGRQDLVGPLAHLYLNRAGTFYVVAAGLCYHAGKSRKETYTNGRRIGIEALAAGDGWAQDWPVAQMTAYARGCRALTEHYRFPVSEVLGHKETCAPEGRKIDPSFDMRGFREGVATVDLRKDADMTPEELLDTKVKLTPQARELLKGDTATVRELLQWPPADRAARNEIAAGRAEQATQFATLVRLLSDINTTLKSLADRLPPAQ